MLPIYNATKFIQILELGGHTKPWLIEVEVEGNPLPFVMKVYTTLEIKSRNRVTAEVIGNILAKEFDLYVPAAALIDISSENFQMSLSGEALFLLESKIDERMKFGTQYIEGCRKADAELPKEIYDYSIELDTLYAFDNFIRNKDRTRPKSNLLLQDDTQQLWLIDHEMAFQDVNTENFDKVLGDTINVVFTSSYHFAYDYLKEENEEIKSQYFSTFIEYLRYLDFSKLNSYFEQLENYGYITEKESIFAYLNFIKNNSSLFFTILKQSLT